MSSFFALHILPLLQSTKSSANCCVSPITIRLLLRLCAYFSGGTTATRLQPYQADVDTSSLSTTSLVWINQNNSSNDYQFSDQALCIAKELETKLASGMKFNINEWVSKATDGLIPKLLDNQDIYQFILAVTTLFKGEFTHPFSVDNTIPRPFTAPPVAASQNAGTITAPPVAASQNAGTITAPPVAASQNAGTITAPPVAASQNAGTITAPPVAASQNAGTIMSPANHKQLVCMMSDANKTGQYWTAPDTSCYMRLTYTNGCAGIFILPPSSESLVEFVTRSTKETLMPSELVGAAEKKGNVFLPRFHVETKGVLASVLDVLGDPVNFSTIDPSLSAISRDLLDARHSTVVKTDETGTVAASVAYVGSNRGGSSRSENEWIGNRPFIHLITRKEEILFISMIQTL